MNHAELPGRPGAGLDPCAAVQTAIELDLDWLEEHRRLQVRALEWHRKKDISLLLRGRDLRSLGVGLHQWRTTLAMGLVLAAVQFAVTMVGYSLPDAEQWVPLLGMSLVVGLFEAVFFRGFVQGRLEASFGPVPAVVGAAVLYAVYHVGYGMALGEMWFLLGLGVVYAVAYRLTTNILILWPLLTPLGAFFNNLDNADIELPWVSLLGFADVAALMLAALWLAHRRIRRRDAQPH